MILFNNVSNRSVINKSFTNKNILMRSTSTRALDYERSQGPHGKFIMLEIPVYPQNLKLDF